VENPLSILSGYIEIVSLTRKENVLRSTRHQMLYLFREGYITSKNDVGETEQSFPIRDIYLSESPTVDDSLSAKGAYTRSKIWYDVRLIVEGQFYLIGREHARYKLPLDRPTVVSAVLVITSNDHAKRGNRVEISEINESI